MDTLSAPPPAILRLSQEIWELMRAEVSSNSPQEACGLLGGRTEGETYLAQAVYPVDNELHSPTRFRMAPRGQLQAMDAIDAQGLEIIAIYHSHPFGPSYPSPTDLDEAEYPQCVYLIWSWTAPGEWSCRGFTIQKRLIPNAPPEITTEEVRLVCEIR
jgi:proteasome lid subunit RPN8/RPN11